MNLIPEKQGRVEDLRITQLSTVFVSENCLEEALRSSHNLAIRLRMAGGFVSGKGMCLYISMYPFT